MKEVIRMSRNQNALGAGLLLAGLVLVSSCISNAPSLVSAPTATATLESPSPTPAATSAPLPPTPTPVRAHRAQEFHNRTGIELKDSGCAIHCISNAPKYPITLAEFVKAAGAPERAFSLVDGAAGQFIVTLLYIEQGMMVDAHRRIGNDINDATPDMIVYRIDLFRSRTLDGIKQEMVEMDQFSLPLEGAQSWTGFGPVSELGR